MNRADSTLIKTIDRCIGFPCLNGAIFQKRRLKGDCHHERGSTYHKHGEKAEKNRQAAAEING